MPKSFEVKTASGAYVVEIGRGLTSSLLERNPSAVSIIDERLRDCIPPDRDHIIALPATEEQKSLERMPEVILALRGMKGNRGTHIVAVGGGVIQDIATFVCSVYMRGLRWSYMPTTMLGMADSCLGGKSSINVGGLKNLIGNIYPPHEVVIDTDFVTTLDADQTIGGLIEAAKICFARSYDEFCSYEALHPTYPLTPVHAESLIMHSLTAKRWFIETDEFDKKERLLLNYGHTFGHALESATNFAIAHGLAVGMGIIAANALALRYNWLSPGGEAAVQHLQRHIVGMIKAASSPLSEEIPLSKVLDKFDSDKKHLSDHYRIVAPQGDGALTLLPLPKTRASLDMISVGVVDACHMLDWPLEAH